MNYFFKIHRKETAIKCYISRVATCNYSGKRPHRMSFLLTFAKFLGMVSSCDQLLCYQRRKGIAREIKNLLLIKILITFSLWETVINSC